MGRSCYSSGCDHHVSLGFDLIHVYCLIKAQENRSHAVLDDVEAVIGSSNHIWRACAVVWDVEDCRVLDSDSYITSLENDELTSCKRDESVNFVRTTILTYI